MQKFSPLLLDVWREVCRHMEIASSTANLTKMLAAHLPLDLLIVRRFHVKHSSLETIAWGTTGSATASFDIRKNISPTRFKRLLAWASSGKILRSRTRKPTGELALMSPGNLEGDVLIGPLVGSGGPLGVLIFHASKSETFTTEHIDLATALLEPFSAALENDLRLHELATLREAAEADKQSLLTRLGRKDTGENIVGAEAGLRPVMERVNLVSRSDVPVLILGETGTGKEVVSRAIHARSTRTNAPFIRVNCGAIPAELIDSQLFGHERGSFTGADDTRKGWFERADGGTLFLDEIGELPLPAQVRLLRVLQDGYIERVGGAHPIRIDVRIVAATHRDLPEMVKTGTFREDLWYRIATFPILLPPLRERREDIPSLARHFAERAANRFGLALASPTSSDLSILMNYGWPGNIRELGAVIDRAAILGDGKSLEVAKALGGAAEQSPERVAPTQRRIAGLEPRELIVSQVNGHSGHDHKSFPTLDTVMIRHIEHALNATRGKVEGPYGAAKLLGINPHTLRARMRKHKVEWGKFREPNLD